MNTKLIFHSKICCIVLLLFLGFNQAYGQIEVTLEGVSVSGDGCTEWYTATVSGNYALPLTYCWTYLGETECVNSDEVVFHKSFVMEQGEQVLSLTVVDASNNNVAHANTVTTVGLTCSNRLEVVGPGQTGVDCSENYTALVSGKYSLPLEYCWSTATNELGCISTSDYYHQTEIVQEESGDQIVQCTVSELINGIPIVGIKDVEIELNFCIFDVSLNIIGTHEIGTQDEFQVEIDGGEGPFHMFFTVTTLEGEQIYEDFTLTGNQFVEREFSIPACVVAEGKVHYNMTFTDWGNLTTPIVKSGIIEASESVFTIENGSTTHLAIENVAKTHAFVLLLDNQYSGIEYQWKTSQVGSSWSSWYTAVSSNLMPVQYTWTEVGSQQIEFNIKIPEVGCEVKVFKEVEVLPQAEIKYIFHEPEMIVETEPETVQKGIADQIINLLNLNTLNPPDVNNPGPYYANNFLPLICCSKYSSTFSVDIYLGAEIELELAQPLYLPLSVHATASGQIALGIGQSMQSDNVNNKCIEPYYVLRKRKAKKVLVTYGTDPLDSTHTIIDNNVLLPAPTNPIIFTLKESKVEFDCDGFGHKHSVELPNPRKNKEGYIQVEAFGGKPPYQFDWTHTARTKGTDGKRNRVINRTGTYLARGEGVTNNFVLANLEEGTLCYTITDINCCEIQNCIEIPCLFDANATITPASCGVGAEGGTLLVNPVTIVPPLKYHWSNGSQTNYLTGLEPGVYTVTITNGDGCYFIDDFEIEAETNFNISTILTPSSYCSPTGGIQIIEGPGGPYTYQWSDGSTKSSLKNIGIGDYCVTITDKQGCVNIECFTIGPVPPISIDLDVEQDCGDETAQVTASIQGGTAPYTYYWSTGENGPTVNSVPTGAHTLLIKDAAGCEKFKTFKIKAKPQMEVVSEAQAPQCPWNSGQGSAEVIVSGGTPPYSYLWSTGQTTSSIGWLGLNLYYVDITDAAGCTEHVEFDFTFNPDMDFTSIVSPTTIGCDNGSGTIEINATGGGVPYVYFLQGPNGYANSSAYNLFNDLQAGDYTITVYGACGNSVSGDIVVEGEMNTTPFKMDWLVTPSCNNSAQGLGTIDLTVSGLGSFTYQWNNGATSEDLKNLLPGTYEVTVTNMEGCEQSSSIEVPFEPIDFNTTSSVTHNCNGPTIGAIDLTINTPGKYSYQWSNGSSNEDLSNLAAGTYTVTITNTEGCMEVHTFTIQDETNFDYEVEVVWYFLNNTISGGGAQVKIISDVFDWGGQLNVSTSSSMNPVFYSTKTSSRNYENITIPLQYASIGTFYFTYTSADGCVYQGTFDMVPVCLPGDSFNFDLVYDGNAEESCGAGQNHSYTLDVNSNEFNPPYYVRVTMIEAVDEGEAEFDQVFEYTGQGPFVISGIPAGRVKFESYNHCDDFFYSTIHNNCCFDFSCELIEETFNPADDGIRSYKYPFFSLKVQEECFDAGCVADDCSRVWADLNTVAPTFNCWTGTVTIEYPDGPVEVFMVLESGDIIWLSQREDKWQPPNPGSFFVNIIYNNPDGQCVVEREVNFYGSEDGGENFNDAIVFNDQFWFNGGALMIPDEFMNANFGAWSCENCSPINEYIYNNDQDACEGFDNAEFTFFSFTPNSTVDPCNSGGEITIMNFENGVASVQVVPVPAGASQGELPDMQPFGLLEDYWCFESGWCLFDAEDIYGFEMDKFLLATWATPGSCVEVDFSDPSTPNDEPICDPVTNPCGFGYTCVLGTCYQICEGSDDCLNDGTCEDNLCVGDESCNPSCPGDLECHLGSCYQPEFCGFFEKVSGGNEAVTYNFWHELAPGTEVTLGYNTLTREDELFISVDGVEIEHIGCVPTEGWKYFSFPVGNGNSVTVEVVPCESGSQFHLEITCSTALKGNRPTSSSSRNSKTSSRQADVLVHPNPFIDNFEITLNHVKDDFKGQLLILDRLGRAVTNQELVVEAGYNSFNIDGLGDLPTGVYIILLKNGGDVYTSKKIVKLE